MDKEISKPCCEKKSKDSDCCKKIINFNKLSSDISTVNASVSMPDIFLFATAYLNAFHFVLSERKNNYLEYNPPKVPKDISVLFRVFRI
jgi:hypothetical protein